MEENFSFLPRVDLIGDLMNVIKDFTLSLESDAWRWRHSSDGFYYMVSTYSYLMICEFLSDNQITFVELALHINWSSLTPLKS